MHLRFLSAGERTQPLCPSRHSTPAGAYLRWPLLWNSLQLTRQHPYLAVPQDPVHQVTCFSYGKLIFVIKWVSWGPRKRDEGGGVVWRVDPLCKNFAGVLSTSMKLNTCNAASQECLQCCWMRLTGRAGPSPAVRWRRYSLQAPAQSEIRVKLNHMLTV